MKTVCFLAFFLNKLKVVSVLLVPYRLYVTTYNIVRGYIHILSYKNAEFGKLFAYKFTKNIKSNMHAKKYHSMQKMYEVGALDDTL